MKLERIAKGAQISEIELGKVVRVVSADRLSDYAVTIDCKADRGRSDERVLFRLNESELTAELLGRPRSLDADGADLALAAEAGRANLAHLVDPTMAAHTSNVAPLLRQATAVYETMPSRQLLRCVRADGPPKDPAAHQSKSAPRPR